MPIVIRGSVTRRDLVVQRLTFAGVRLWMLFEVFDTAAPATVLHAHEEPWDYDYDRLVGLTGPQLLVLIRDTGQTYPPQPLPGGPVTPPPYPPPMRQRAREILDEYNDGAGAIAAQLVGEPL